jgi:hypothetical protein
MSCPVRLVSHLENKPPPLIPPLFGTIFLIYFLGCNCTTAVYFSPCSCGGGGSSSSSSSSSRHTCGREGSRRASQDIRRQVYQEQFQGKKVWSRIICTRLKHKPKATGSCTCTQCLSWLRNWTPPPLWEKEEGVCSCTRNSGLKALRIF